MARVTAVRTRALSIPLHTPFVTALRRTSTVQTLLVELETDSGTIGLGESPQVWQVTGESIAGAAACVQDLLAPLLLGAQLQDWQPVCRAVQRVCARNFGAKSAVETALLDALGRELGLPMPVLLADLLGLTRPTRSVLATDVTVSAGSPTELAATSARRVAEGFTHLKLKVGTDAGTDVTRVRAVREAVGPDVPIRLDANQGWSREDAVSVVRALADAELGIEFVEQPVAGGDVEGLAWVRERVPLPVVADEAVYGELDLDRVLRLGAADGVNIKLAKCGGPMRAIGLLTRARDGGLDTMVGSMMESHLGVGITAAAALAAGGSTLLDDLDAAWWTLEAPYRGGLAYRGPELLLPDLPGLGIDLAPNGACGPPSSVGANPP